MSTDSIVVLMARCIKATLPTTRRSRSGTPIAPNTRCTCLKDFVWAKPKGKWIPDNTFAGEGMVPWEAYFKLIKALKIGGPASVHCEWELFTKGELALPEAERRALAVRKMKRDADFFRSQLEKYGVTTGA